MQLLYQVLIIPVIRFKKRTEEKLNILILEAIKLILTILQQQPKKLSQQFVIPQIILNLLIKIKLKTSYNLLSFYFVTLFLTLNQLSKF